MTKSFSFLVNIYINFPNFSGFNKNFASTLKKTDADYNGVN